MCSLPLGASHSLKGQKTMLIQQQRTILANQPSKKCTKDNLRKTAKHTAPSCIKKQYIPTLRKNLSSKNLI